MTMETWALTTAITVISLVITGVSPLECYKCLINPSQGENYKTATNLCTNFDYSDSFIVDCPFSTMCMKQDFHLDIQNGVRIEGVLRDCAPQKHEYQDFKNGKWSPKTEVLEPYKEGCFSGDDKGERVTTSRYCYCRSNLCNSTPSTNHEGYTDIMGVILVFNLMKYINSLR
ncbi:uncharacterized protein LOC106721551 [Papilio machaon]|uniref:uncharacterized protein LOC106721551 n=1 Tax=Papilio machaon TaxID=76193 RepID=UPI001E665D2A|nr:uncharacterized protein LOC106721551 [Papilio machaon]